MRRKRVFVAALALLAVAWFGSTFLSLRESVDSLSDLKVPTRPEAQSPTQDSASTIGEARAVQETEESAQRDASFPAPIQSAAAEVPIFERTYHGGIDPETGERRLLATLRETQRGENFSYLESSLGDVDQLVAEFEKNPPPNVWAVTSQAIHHYDYGGMYELACLRGFRHFIVVAERGMSGFFVYLTNDDSVPLRELLGDQYTEDAQRFYDRMGYAPSRWQTESSGPRSCFIMDGSSLFHKYQQDCPQFAASVPAHCKAVLPSVVEI
jgi:hypothetical protein